MLAFIFWVDLNIPLGFAGGSVYIFPVLLISMTPGKHPIITTTIMACFLTILGFYFSPQTDFLTIAFVNRIFSISAIVIIAFFGVSNNNKQRILTDQASALKKQNLALDEYANIAAHDLQEPLRKIQTFSSFLKEDHNHQLDEEGRHITKVIHDSSRRMRNLINDMLDYARLSKEPGLLKTISLDKVIEKTLEDFSLQIEKTNTNLSITPLPDVFGNESQMQCLFQNLFSNAFKYSEPKRDLKISINHDEEENNFIYIYFEDNGIGFDESLSTQIFNPLVRLETKEGIKGTGMGLAQCKKIMKNINGNIIATPKVSGGVIFTLQFPLNKDL
jgi:light-regulated signal transduction histidine kinase (bacteriophytochrome)